MRFGSVCSGIEAASVAWHPLGWQAAWLSEIEPFPSAVLAHHYPDVPNLGDMTTLPERILSGEVEAPDLFCGGTPCQAFSVAGLRKSLDDARGNLSLVFCEIANAIDSTRRSAGKPPAIIFWENVPGVLSTQDNAFGCFLSGLAGEEAPVVPPGGKWPNAGVVLGPERAVAWRILDAQYFGVAQRRRRVYVVASARDGFDPATVLFEFDGVRRDSAPSREARQETAASAGASPTFSCAGIGAYTSDDTAATLLKSGQDLGNGCEALITKTFDRQSSGEYGTQPVASTVAARDYKGPSDLVSYGIPGNWIGRKPENGGNAVEPMHNIAPCLTKTDQHGVAHPIAFHVDAQPDQMTFSGETTATLTASQRAGVAEPMPINTMVALRHEALGRGTGFGIGEPGDPAYTMTKGHTHAVAVSEPTAWTTKLHNTGSNNAGKIFEERTTCLDANSPPPALLTAMQVRRLTPVECERLQGFSDGYTMIPWRKKPAEECPDGPRYKALGNSWAVPVVRWIGKRIDDQAKSAASRTLFFPTEQHSVVAEQVC
jgi:DNA (cytosine-5)-methyltransferase 1